jgi:hypothetical protein
MLEFTLSRFFKTGGFMKRLMLMILTVAMPAVALEPVVTVREKVTAEKTVAVPSAVSSFTRSIKVGNLMQLDHVPAIWTI